MATPRPAVQQERAAVSVDPLWIVATALLVCIACLDYGAIVGSPGLIVAGVVAGAVGVAVMLQVEQD